MEADRKLKILKEVFGYCYKSGSEWLFYCPKCKHHKPKLSVNLGKNCFKCWVCQYSGSSVFRLVRKYGNFLQRQAWEEFESVVDLSVSLYEQMFGDTEEHEEATLNLPEEFRSLANKKVPLSGIPARNYLKERGVTKADIIRWKIGYCATGKYAQRVIIPSFNLDGRINYFIARSYGNGYKYKNPEGATKDIIFNHLYTDWKNPVHIVEGAFDAIVAGNAIPMLQCSMREESKLFQEITKHDTPVYIALDPEAEKEAMGLIRRLLEYDVECYKVNISGEEDVSEMGKERYSALVEEAELMNPTRYLQKLARGINV